MMLTAENTIDWLNLFTEKINENKAYLSELDTPIGDGDHGNNLARGVAAYQEAFAKTQPTTISAVFQTMAMALVSKVGGASGPLYGTAFLNMAKATKDLPTITSNQQLAEVLTQGVEGIQLRGKATAGEKTMVDVWLPVITLISEDQLTLEKIAAASDATKDLVATKGRASYLGQRSKGHIDPGAASSSLLFETLLTILN